MLSSFDSVTCRSFRLLALLFRLECLAIFYILKKDRVSRNAVKKVHKRCGAKLETDTEVKHYINDHRSKLALHGG